MLIYHSQQLDPDLGPVNLQRKVQFDVRYYFCRCGSENMYEMMKDTFKLGYDTQTKMSYAFKAKDEMTKNHQESDNPIVSGYMPQILNPDGSVNKLCQCILMRIIWNI